MLAPGIANAGWVQDGTSVSTDAGNQHLPVVCSDGAGGSIIAWYDHRNGAADIYAQRFNSQGLPIWTLGGVPVCTEASAQSNPVIVADGSGGAIIAWDDARGGGDIYVQRLSAAANPYWTINGVAACSAIFQQDRVAITSDGSGGVVLAWQDFRGSTMDIYAQRISGMGNPLWTANGVALCTADQWQSKPVLIADGSGGAIVAWEDLRSFIDYDVFAQRINGMGAPMWTAGGIPISVAGGAQNEPTMTRDDTGGAIIAWKDSRSGLNIYAQRVNTIGAVQWTTDGVVVCNEASSQITPLIASDGNNGAIVAWYDYRSTSVDIYAQRLGPTGTRQWTADGIVVTAAASDQVRACIVPDGTGGAVVAWDDSRSGGSYDVYAQRVSAAGAMYWTPNGALVSAAASWQQSPGIAADNAGGVVIAWNDARSGTYDIYAQRLELGHGAWGHPEPYLTTVADVAQDQGGKVAVNWKASDHDVLPGPSITHYSVWRAVDIATFSALSGGADAGGSKVVSSPASVARDFRGSAVYHERVNAQDYYFEWVANQTATQGVAYSLAAATRANTVGLVTAPHYFQVVAHTGDASVVFKSTVMSGESVDNLAPEPPFILAAFRSGGDVHLRWNRVRVPDLRDYAVYRATASGVTPVPIHFLGSAEDTVLIDSAAPASTLYYIVTAYDVHENQSLASNEAMVSGSTGVGGPPSITALTLLQNFPNPFSSTTDFEIGLVKPSTVDIAVYDVAGRRVASSSRSLAAGWQRVTFDGRNERGQKLPSGVYFYRVTANGETTTRKMVIGR